MRITPHQEKVLKQAHTRFFRGKAVADSGERIDWENPLDALAEADRDAEDEIDISFAEDESRAKQIAFDAYRSFHDDFIAWLFEAGPNPVEVTKRLFAYAKAKNAELLWNMNFRDLGELFGETHAAFHARSKNILNGATAPWCKGRDARAEMAKSARGNKNRSGGAKTKIRQSSFLKKLKIKPKEKNHD